jgi:hypothetical protein
VVALAKDDAAAIMEDMSKTNATLCLSEVVPSGDRHLYFRCVYRLPMKSAVNCRCSVFFAKPAQTLGRSLLGPEFLRLLELDPEF